MHAYYHGTTEAAARAILEQGPDLDAEGRRDAGDFGCGFYLTRNKARARSYGEHMLKVWVDTSRCAHIPNPYFIRGFDPIQPETGVERLFHGLVFDEHGAMRTVQGPLEERIAAAKMVQRAFLARGYLGITTEYEGDIVLFSDTAVRRVQKSGHCS